jgi:hypothetical protein
MYAQIRSNQLPKPFKTREAQAVCWFDLYLWDKSWLKVEALALPLIKWLPRSAVVEGMRA